MWKKTKKKPKKQQQPQKCWVIETWVQLYCSLYFLLCLEKPIKHFLKRVFLEKRLSDKTLT